MDRGSQYDEIKWLMANRKLPTKGIFVEVGASDGLENSNTYELEQLGWTGLLVEPDERSFQKLKSNRPNAILEQCAVSSIEHDQGVFFLNGEPTWSGLTQNLSPAGTAIVKLRRLDTLLSQHKIDHVDVLSIDTEGTEIDAWHSRGPCLPDIVIIEYMTVGTSNSHAVLKTLEHDGYRLIHATEVNHIFEKSGE